MDKPILFSAPMVLRLLCEAESPGTGKTQTRRIMIPQPEQRPNGTWHVFNRGGGVIGVNESDVPSQAIDYITWAPGDRLWVREAMERANGDAIGYRADRTWLPNTPWIWKRNTLPSIHMPRHLSRLTLAVRHVRVQRLQDISEEDAIAEGISTKSPGFEKHGVYNCILGDKHHLDDSAYRLFSKLWNHINGPGSWESNPWVAALTFNVYACNIDAMPTDLAA